MKKLAIKHGDNDFSCTFHHVLNTIKQAREHGTLDIDTVTKEQLVGIVNELTPICYSLFQASGSWQTCPEHTREYLAILKDNTLPRILIDNEVDEYIERNNFNHDCVVWDIGYDYLYCL